MDEHDMFDQADEIDHQDGRDDGQAPGSAAARGCGGAMSGYFVRGQTLFEGGERGDPWRVCAGVVRLSRETPAGPEFGGLARAGDVIGAETLMFGMYTYTAVALSPVMLEPWLSSVSPDRERGLLLALAAAERRIGEVVALRGGKAVERVKRLLGLLAGPAGQSNMSEASVVLPRLKDIAEITDLKVETVSRTITQMTEDGELVFEHKRRARLAC